MPEIEWRKEFETGVLSIDHEHRRMVERLNRLFKAVQENAGVETIIEELAEVYAWISAHFALEEEIMRAHKYDQYPEHKEDHESLLDDLRDIMDDCQEGTFSSLDDALQQRVHDWFVEHFKTKDARLHKHLGDH